MIGEYGKDNIVFISIYNRDDDTYINKKIEVKEISRNKNRELVINSIINILLEIL